MAWTKEQWLEFCDRMIKWCNQIIAETSISIELDKIIGGDCEI